MASIKRWKFKKIFGFVKQKPSELFEPKSNSKISSNLHVPDPEETSDRKSMQPKERRNRKISKMVTMCPKISDSLAIVKNSKDPYGDFCRSMLEMILEMQIYCADDLQELLTCFLQINSPDYHQIIVQVFTDIWNIGVDSEKQAKATAAALQPRQEKKLPPCSSTRVGPEPRRVTRAMVVPRH